MTFEEYRVKVYEDVFPKGTSVCGENNLGITRSYFDGHWTRFAAQVEMFEKHLAKEKIELVYDLGTGCPFASYWFNLALGSRVMFGFPFPGKDVNEKVKNFIFDFTSLTELEKADVVIATETIEHLPCNTYRVRQFIAETVKPGGHLVVSFPLGGQNAKDYHLDNIAEYGKLHEHLREFTEHTARDWYIGTGFDLVEERTVFSHAYGGQIMNVLLKKRAYGR